MSASHPSQILYFLGCSQSFLLPPSSARINRQLRHCSPHNPIVACLFLPSAAAAAEGVPRLMLLLLLLRRLSVRLALLLRDGAGGRWGISYIQFVHPEKSYARSSSPPFGAIACIPGQVPWAQRSLELSQEIPLSHDK